MYETMSLPPAACAKEYAMSRMRPSRSDLTCNSVTRTSFVTVTDRFRVLTKWMPHSGPTGDMGSNSTNHSSAWVTCDLVHRWNRAGPSGRSGSSSTRQPRLNAGRENRVNAFDEIKALLTSARVFAVC